MEKKIENLIEKVDTLIIGGGMAYTFFKAKGYGIGTSICEDDKIDLAKSLLEKAEENAKQEELQEAKQQPTNNVVKNSKFP